MTPNKAEWENEPVEVARPLGAVVSVRFPQDIAERVFEEAQRQGVATSAFVRQAVESYLTSMEEARTSFDMSVSSRDVNVSFYAGRSGSSRSAGHARNLDEAMAR